MKRKKVGLALGSGAARGFAHLGVLQVMEENGIPIDFISGCSIGALVGALYCSGMKVDEIIELAEDTDTWQMIDFSPPGKGLIFGKKIEKMVRMHTDDKTFDDLKIPLSVVATDLHTGERCILDQGYVYKAVRCSIAIPGIFRPVEMEGRLLADGGIVDAVPVDLARYMGAEMIIGVNLGAHYAEKKIENIYHTIIQSIDIMQNEINRLRGIEADVVIEPDLKDINPIAFNQVGECVRAGRKAALDAIDDIRNVLNPPPRWGLLKNLGRRRST